MKLFSSKTSPYARKVRIVILEYGLGDKIEILNTAPMGDPDDLHAANPVGKVPTLLLGDGTALYDSPVICEYFDSHGDNRFIPQSGVERWDCLRRQALADGVMDTSFNRTGERLRPQGEQSDTWLGRWERAIRRSIDVMESDLSIAGDRFDLGDVAAGCALGYLDLRHGDMGWRENHQLLAEWFEAFSGRASASATVHE